MPLFIINEIEYNGILQDKIKGIIYSDDESMKVKD